MKTYSFLNKSLGTLFKPWDYSRAPIIRYVNEANDKKTKSRLWQIWVTGPIISMYCNFSILKLYLEIIFSIAYLSFFQVSVADLF